MRISVVKSYKVAPLCPTMQHFYGHATQSRTLARLRLTKLMTRIAINKLHCNKTYNTELMSH